MAKRLFKPFGAWGIKLINNFIAVVKSLPKWRIFLLVLQSAIFTYITTYLLSGFVVYLISNSITLSGLHLALVEIVGNRKFETINEFFLLYSKVFILIFFLCYLYLLYRRERKKQYIRNLFQMMNEIGYIAEGNFEHQIETFYNNELDTLATNINNIVLQLKNAIAEERHLEHTKNELITNVSHDLRTPLTSTIGYLGLIEQDKYRDEVELRHYTGIAYDKALSLEHLINELFEYTRMQDKRLILNKVPINIAEILGQLIIQNHLQFNTNNISCREFISTEKMLVLGDGEKLARVFDNLITNAINYGKDGKYIDITAKEENDTIIVIVTNYGEPIPNIDIPHIFERFYRAEKSRSMDTGGSGLGLAIAKSIIAHHDGTIEVESNMEKTSFIVRLKKLKYLSP
ncbi:sensor histidine kinase [Bacillus sp. FSL K6-3431]|uniref:sensor histidine kinase n=1 Tax=Bacillus sp. FSL K6-3431 TaxID=2921500 RepID=UPI0030F62570